MKAKTEKKSVAEIITENILKKIEENNVLPWEKPFISFSRNYITKKNYRGINLFTLRDGAEWFTLKQLNEYNKKNKTSFKIPDLRKFGFVAFFKKYLRELNEDEKEALSKGLLSPTMLKSLKKDDNGDFKIEVAMLRYTKAYNAYDAVDEDGNHLPNINDLQESFDDVSPEESFNKAENIIQNYCNSSGVKINNYASSGFYYEHNDTVNTPPLNLFKSKEEFYITMFHELIHSTGTHNRLKRNSFKKYHFQKEERSMEEMVAEFGACLLASECHFKSDISRDNAENYVVGWYQYIKDHPNALVNAMAQAQKACDYILLKDAKSTSCDNDIEIAV